jgi:hypothetical protein
MTPIVWTYIVYIALSIPLTIWVAHTLYKNGRVFLIDSFRGNERLADSVNHLLVVGFYLINIGYVALALKERIAPQMFAKCSKRSVARLAWSCSCLAPCISSTSWCFRKCVGAHFCKLCLRRFCRRPMSTWRRNEVPLRFIRC